MINDWENIIAYCEESEHRDVLGNKFSLFQIQLGYLGKGGGGVETPGKFVILTLTKAWKHYFQHLNCQKIFI